MTSIDIPSSVTSIEGSAFYGCKNIETVTCLAEIVPSTATDAFKDAYVDYATLQVPESAISAYMAKEPWRSFGTIKAIGALAVQQIDESSVSSEYYTLNGVKADNPTRAGTYIVKQGDKIKKVLMR